MGKRRAVFLDRDGVINSMVYHSEFGIVDSPVNPDEFVLLPGVTGAINTLNQLPLRVIVVSNQPGIAKGKMTSELLDAVTEKMVNAISSTGGRLDEIYYCLHHPQAIVAEYRKDCACRKPEPGLLLKAAKEWEIDLEHSYIVGDGVTDVLAGKAAGVTTILICSRKLYVYDELEKQKAWPDYRVHDLSEAATIVSNLENSRLKTKPKGTAV